MIFYIISQVHHILREALVPALAPQVTLSRTRYVVQVNGTLHRVRRDRVCNCGGTPESPCPAATLIQDYLAAGGAKPLGRHPDTWPETWLRIPLSCPICDCPVLADPYLNSIAGPGWKCSLAGYRHFWQVRTNPLRRFLARHPALMTYPWTGSTPPERQAWLETHYHPPRITAAEESEGDNHHALDREKESKGQHRPRVEKAGVEPVWLQRRPIGHDDRLS